MPAPDDGIPLDEVARRFSRACRSADVPYVLVGGFAVVAWGQPRTTSGLDALVRYEKDDVERWTEALAAEGLETSVRDLRLGLEQRSHVSIFTEDPVLTVDVRPALDARETDEIRDAVEIDLGGEPVRIARAEDTVVFKLVFGSEQDRQDARSILARQGDRLDEDRLTRLADREGVLGSLRSLQEEVDEAIEELDR